MPQQAPQEALNILLHCEPAEVDQLVAVCGEQGEVRRVRYDLASKQLSLAIPAQSPVRWQFNHLQDALGEHLRAISWFDLDYDEHDLDRADSMRAFFDGMQTFGEDVADDAFELEHLPEYLALHAEFLAAGGGGGRWETTSFLGVVFGGYVGPKPERGKQFSMAFQEFPALNLDGHDLSYSRCNSLVCEQLSVRYANLQGSLWVDSSLPGADFSGSDLRQADFSRCDLTGAKLQQCDLRGADLEGADLSGADLTGARTENVHWHGTNLTGTLGLKSP